MNHIFVKRLKTFDSFFSFYFLIAFFMWIKTYVTQLTQFELGVEGFFQHALLFLNPLGSVLFILGIAFLLKNRKKYLYLIISYTFMTILLFANILYYRYFNDFITLPNVMQTSNFGNLGTSVFALVKPTDFLLFIDIFIFSLLLIKKIIKMDFTHFSRQKALAILIFGLGIFSLNLSLAEVDRPQLLTRGFDRNYIVKYLGMYNYTVYDVVQTAKASAQRALADNNDVVEAINYTRANYAPPNPEYFGIAKGKNIIYIHLESIQEFLIDYKLHGEEVTPFLNSLTKDPNTIYFDNFFHQTAQGKTADAEFLIENSLYGLSQGSAFYLRGQNSYHAAPAILKDYGYTSAVFHGNAGSFWNRNEIYKSFGYDYFFDANFYEITSENMAEYGLMDKPFFKQSMDYLTALPEPFYTKFITVTNHHPFHLEPELATIGKANTGDEAVDNYFQTARYADEALEEFFAYLKDTGLLDRSIIIMYGDHYAISENHNRAMSEIIGREITPFENAGLQRVPLFIRIPGIEGGVNHTYGGQVDILPTLLHLLGIEAKNFIHFGTDLLSPTHQQLVPFRNGNYVSPTIYHVEEKYYSAETGEEITEEDERYQQAIEYKNMVEKRLATSDAVVNGDLLRFYLPENFTPIDRTKYDYSKGVEK